MLRFWARLRRLTFARPTKRALRLDLTVADLFLLSSVDEVCMVWCSELSFTFDSFAVPNQTLHDATVPPRLAFSTANKTAEHGRRVRKPQAW